MRSKPVILCIVLIICMSLIGCFSSDNPANESVATTDDTTDRALDANVTLSVIALSASQDSISFNSTTQVSATLYDDTGTVIPGVPVTFSIDRPDIASITTGVVSDESGVATATLTSRGISGEVQVSASVGEVSSATPKTIVIYDGVTPESITVTSNPTAVVFGGTATITATVLDATGNSVANGTQVVFEIDNSSFGTVTGIATTNAGVATATFEAGNMPGVSSITASAGSVNSSTNITILDAPASSIEFVSAVPNVVAISGSGGNETSVIQFKVKDTSGDPVEGEVVTVSMKGPNGGEYIDSSGDGTPRTIIISSNASGITQVILNSGTVAGPVTVTASITVDGKTVSVNSSVVSIGGGVPSAKRFTAAATHLNLPGLEWVGALTDITIFMADRFGNYNILDGTTVSFATETGLSIDTAEVTTNENGIASVTARTQNSPEDVAELAWETTLRTYVDTTFTFENDNSPTGYPRKGLSTILIHTKGEEHFNDNNANGVYDTGDTFIDTVDDPFCDFNDDNTYTAAGGADPPDLYIDSEPTNGIWDGNNGVWDSNKNIFLNFPILLTGEPEYIGLHNVTEGIANNTTFNVADGSYVDFEFYVSDVNLNPPLADTEVEITLTEGDLAGRIKYTYDEINWVGGSAAEQLKLLTFSVRISDKNAGDADPKKLSKLSMTVKWSWKDDSGADLSFEDKVTVTGYVD
ncbi:MAG: Ig-like domain-containing protein [Pseudomonadota bacterium]